MLTQGDAVTTAMQLAEGPRRHEQERLERIHHALQPDIDTDDVHVPRDAKAEMLTFARKSRTNYLPLVVDVLSQSLRVVGYRPARSADDSPVWDIWQANGMDARQTGIHRAALRYGMSYVLVLPGEAFPSLRGFSPRDVTVVYGEDDDEWPLLALRKAGHGAWRLYDEEAEYFLGVEEGVNGRPEWRFIESRVHGLGVCPWVRYRDRMEVEDDLPLGAVEPLIPIQHRIDETVFGLLTAQHFSAFHQRWITGWDVPKDSDGRPIRPLDASVRKLWAFADPDVRIGEFAQTDLGGYLSSKDSAVRDLSAISQLPPQAFLGAVANMSAEALAAAEAGKDRRAEEIETSLGESHEQMLRLAALAWGDEASAEDTSAEVRWADTTARSLAQAVDALGKAAQMLGVPPQGLWPMIPGVSEQDIARWTALAEQGDSLGQFAAMLDRQTAALMAPATTPEQPA